VAAAQSRRYRRIPRYRLNDIAALKSEIDLDV
jgi:hypothetical protein